MNHDWSVDALTVLSDEQLLERTRLAVGSLAVSRLYLGRCLLAFETRSLSWRRGYSSAVHLAKTLGVHQRTAQEARRVAHELDYLPQLREAAESGSVPWTSLRAVVTKASPETEGQWLELCATLSPDAIEKLVARTEEGEAPPMEPESMPSPLLVKLSFSLPPEVVEVFEETVQSMSRESGRVVSVTDAFVALVAEMRVGQDREAWEQLLEDARGRLDAKGAAVEAEIDALPETPYAVLAAEEVPVPSGGELKVVRPLRFSGTARVVTPAQRAALVRRDGYGCMTPGCENRIWLHVHHVAFYCRGGVTMPDNLVVLCSRCHRNVHEGWLRVSGKAPGGLRFCDAWGRGLLDWEIAGSLLLDTG